MVTKGHPALVPLAFYDTAALLGACWWHFLWSTEPLLGPSQQTRPSDSNPASDMHRLVTRVAQIKVSLCRICCSPEGRQSRNPEPPGQPRHYGAPRKLSCHLGKERCPVLSRCSREVYDIHSGEPQAPAQNKGLRTFSQGITATPGLQAWHLWRWGHSASNTANSLPSAL